MKTSLLPASNNVKVLKLCDVRYRDLEAVNAWLYACSMTSRERHDGCCALMSCGKYSFSNIEHRVTVECRKYYH